MSVPATTPPSLVGKVILITGANTGLGRQAALELTHHHPAHIWLAARTPSTAAAALAAVQARAGPATSVSLLPLDLASFASIAAAARAFLAASPRLDLLFLNAGLMGCPPALTAEGYEVQFGTNHVGHALLLRLLTPLLIRTAEAGAGPQSVRVVSLSSSGHKHTGPEGIRFETLKVPAAAEDDTAEGKGATPVGAYTQSKLANLLYAAQVARHYPQFTTVSLDPGNVNTGLFAREAGSAQMKYLQTEVAPKMWVSVEEGVKNHLWVATAKELRSGAYYEPVGVVGELTGTAVDEALATKLWDWTEKELEGQGI